MFPEFEKYLISFSRALMCFTTKCWDLKPAALSLMAFDSIPAFFSSASPCSRLKRLAATFAASMLGVLAEEGAPAG